VQAEIRQEEKRQHDCEWMRAIQIAVNLCTHGGEQEQVKKHFIALRWSAAGYTCIDMNSFTAIEQTLSHRMMMSRGQFAPSEDTLRR
jgi:hypothetical protein